jgi:hypothetical protein
MDASYRLTGHVRPLALMDLVRYRFRDDLLAGGG